jgi:hypothetical protein
VPAETSETVTVSRHLQSVEIEIGSCCLLHRYCARIGNNCSPRHAAGAKAWNQSMQLKHRCQIIVPALHPSGLKQRARKVTFEHSSLLIHCC